MVLTSVALRKTGSGWEFASEAALEDFVWANLESFLGLTPLKQQYPCLGEICDILAVNNNKQLVVLELKNTEDRYVVQQLTRYYENLLEVKPFQENIDYDNPIRLVAIAPSFHRHNLIDRKHSRLVIEFWQLQVTEVDNNFYLHIHSLDDEQKFQIQIPYRKVNTVSNEDIPEPPKLLLDWLGACSPDEQEAILRMREKILLYDKRMQETIIAKKSINYGRGKTKPCAELVFQRKTHKPVLFLWLPLANVWRENRPLGRYRIWIDGKDVSHVGHVAEGFGKMKPWSEWEKIPESERPRNFSESRCHNSLVPIKIDGYLHEVIGNKIQSVSLDNKLEPMEAEIESIFLEPTIKVIEPQEQFIDLDLIVALALEKWVQRF